MNYPKINIYQFERTWMNFSFRSSVTRFFLSSTFILLFMGEMLGQWKLLYPDIPDVQINDIKFINDNIGFIANDAGSLLRTSDGGDTWKIVFQHQRDVISQVEFLDQKTGFAYSPTYFNGDDLSFIYTEDGGTSWRKSSIAVGDMKAFLPLSSNTLLKTTEYPATIQKLDNFYGNWTTSYTMPEFFAGCLFMPYGELIEFEKLSNNKILVLGASKRARNSGIINDSVSFILESSDSGNSWDTLWCGNKDAANSLFFLNQNIGWMGSEKNLIYKTNDGGHSWLVIHKDSVSNFFITSIFAKDSLNIIALSSGSTLITSTDGGISWSEKQIGDKIENPNNRIYFVNNNKGFYSGNDFYKTTDGGLTWQKESKSYSSSITKIDFVNSMEGWAIGGKTLYKTIDGGTTWTKQFECPGDISYGGLDMIDSLNGWLLSNNIIYHSTDGGLNWTSTILSNNYWITRGISFLNKNVGVIYEVRDFQDNLFSIVTTDGGSTWIKYPVVSSQAPFVSSFMKIKFTDGGLLYFANQQGLWLSRDTAKTWDLNTKVKCWFDGFDFMDSLNGCISTAPDKIAFTSDGGNTWQTVILPYMFQTNDILMAGRDYFGKLVTYIAGYNGNLLYVLEDNPMFIRTIDTYTDSPLNSFSYYRDGNRINMWLAGYGFHVLHLNDYITSNFKDDIVVNSFKLYQNYPNPFNPTTTIKYQIPKSGLVQLKVYDILGREVAALVNEYQTAGEHSIKFTTDNNQQTTNHHQLTSGIYFYTLKTSNFIQVRKMILLK